MASCRKLADEMKRCVEEVLLELIHKSSLVPYPLLLHIGREKVRTLVAGKHTAVSAYIDLLMRQETVPLTFSREYGDMLREGKAIISNKGSPARSFEDTPKKSPKKSAVSPSVPNSTHNQWSKFTDLVESGDFEDQELDMVLSLHAYANITRRRIADNAIKCCHYAYVQVLTGNAATTEDVEGECDLSTTFERLISDLDDNDAAAVTAGDSATPAQPPILDDVMWCEDPEQSALRSDLEERQRHLLRAIALEKGLPAVAMISHTAKGSG
eukprot:Opistho-2@96487